MSEGESRLEASLTPEPAPVENAAPATLAFDQDLLAELSAIIDSVSALRELPPHPSITSGWMTRASLLEWNDAQVAALTRDELDEFAHETAMLRLLGMISADDDLLTLLTESPGAGVLGLYFAEGDALGVVGEPAPLDDNIRSTLAHEVVHSLQDHAYDLEQWLDAGEAAEELTEYAITRRCLVEGDATFAQQQYIDEQELELLPVQLSLEDQRALASVPASIGRYTAFDYSYCAAFAGNLYARGGWSAIDGAFADPPTTTEQILHPQKYRLGEASTLSAAPDLSPYLSSEWELVSARSFGEFDVLNFLLTHFSSPSFAGRLERDPDLERAVEPWSDESLDIAQLASEWPYQAFRVAEIAAAGWGGGALSLYRSPSGDEVVHLTLEWDTERDYREFGVALGLIAEGSRDVAPFFEDAPWFYEEDQLRWHAPYGHAFMTWDADARRIDLLVTESPITLQMLGFALASQAGLPDPRAPLVSAPDVPAVDEVPVDATRIDNCEGSGPRVCLVPVGEARVADLDAVAARLAELSGTDVTVTAAVQLTRTVGNRGLLLGRRKAIRATGALSLLAASYSGNLDDGAVVIGITAHDLASGGSGRDWFIDWGELDDDWEHTLRPNSDAVHIISAARIDPAARGLDVNAEVLEDRIVTLAARAIAHHLGSVGWSGDEGHAMERYLTRPPQIDAIDVAALFD